MLEWKVSMRRNVQGEWTRTWLAYFAAFGQLAHLQEPEAQEQVAAEAQLLQAKASASLPAANRAGSCTYLQELWQLQAISSMWWLERLRVGEC